MCDTGQCPTIIDYNICTFEADRSNDQFYITYDNNSLEHWYVIPYGSDDYGDEGSKICDTIGNGEWKGISIANLNTSNYRSICPGHINTGYSPTLYPTNPGLANCADNGNEGLIITCDPNGGYTGNKISCCLQNMFCFLDTASSKIQSVRDANRYIPQCFDSNNISQNSGTCDPEYRRLGSDKCYQEMFNWCVTDTIEGTITDKWSGSVFIPPGYLATNPCTRLFFSTFYSNSYGDLANDTADPLVGQECYTPISDYYLSDTILVPNPIDFEGPRKAQALLSTAINNYVKNGGILAGVAGDTGVNVSFNQLISLICEKYPGVCINSLQEYCLSVTENDLKRNPRLINLCGCNLSQSVYSLYTDTFQITKECTPYCNTPGTIPVPISFLERGGKKCLESTCVINDVTLNFIDSQVGDQGITLGNFCSSCGTGGAVCSCLLSDITFTSVSSQISGLNLSQQCSGGKCVIPEIQLDGSTQHVSVSCNLEKSKIVTNPTAVKKAGEFIITAIIILLVFIGLIGFFFLAWKLLGIYTNPGIPPEVKLEPDLPYAPSRKFTSILDRGFH